MKIKPVSCPDRPENPEPGSAWTDYASREVVLERECDTVTLTPAECHAIVGAWLALGHYIRHMTTEVGEESTRA